MPSHENDTRTVLTLTTGSKISVLAAIPFLAAAAYFLWVQISIPGAEGSPFWCSSAFSPPTEKFPKDVCQDVVQVFQLRAALLFVTGLLIAGLGLLFFGVDRRVEQRRNHDAYVEADQPDEA